VLVTSRSYEEYVAMFGIDESLIASQRILDCCAGASSFVAVASTRGCRATAADPAYSMSGAELADRVAESNAVGGTIADANVGRFDWSWYGSKQAREQMRKQAMSVFLVDYVTHRERYRPASLPRLQFEDDEFDLALCSHLLFTWADQLGIDWHFAAIRELARVGAEVRIFPTVLQGAGEPVPFWDDLMMALRGIGLDPVLKTVDYEFQVGANRMLVVTRLR
jgi:hypothetical protein